MGVDNGVLSTFCGKLQLVVCFGKINFRKNLITFNDNCKCVKQWGTCGTTPSSRFYIFRVNRDCMYMN